MWAIGKRLIGGVHGKSTSRAMLAEDNTVEIKLDPMHDVDDLYLRRTQHQNLMNLAQSERETFYHSGVVFSYFKRGNPDGPAIVTLHGVGQDSVVAFGNFFNQEVSNPILKEFCVYYINFPGQSVFDPVLSQYPSFDDVASAILAFINHLKKSCVVGFGIGAGANVLIRVSLLQKWVFSRLILVNGYVGPMSWGEWLYQKYHTLDSYNFGTRYGLVSHLLDHYFGKEEPDATIYQFYSEYLNEMPDSTNLRLFMDAFSTRTPVHLETPVYPPLPNLDFRVSIVCPTLLIISGDSLQHDNCVGLRELIQPNLLECIEANDAHGVILDQYTQRVAYAIVLFLQGMGYLRGINKSTYVAPSRGTRPITDIA